jgi:iron complex outermembrane receptor protein
LPLFKISLNKMIRLYTLTCILFLSQIVHAQYGTVKGQIKTQDGQPAPFVNVVLKVLAKGTNTIEDGSYIIKGIPAGTYTLVISFIGLQTIEKPIDISGNQTLEVNLTLTENAQQLQEVVISDTRGLNEFLPSIGKGTINIMDLPQSVMVIDKSVLERQQTLRLSDVLMNTNGVYVMGTTGGTQEEIAGRGFAFGSNNTFKNGSRYNNAVMPEVSALEKVEVLKGSSAILFGQVAAGGVLNLVTKKPKFEQGGQISFRTGSYNFYKPSLDIYGALDKGNHAAYRLNTTYETAGSYRQGVNSERIYFNPSFVIKANKKTQILVEGDYLKDNRTLDYGTAAINYKIADISRSTFLGASWAYYKAEQKSASVSIVHDLNDTWQIKALGSYQGFNSDLFGTTRPNASGNLVTEDGTWVRGLQRTEIAQDYFVAQIDANAKLTTGSITHTVLIGVDADRYVNNTLAYAYANAKGKNIYDTINVLDLNSRKQRSDIPEIAKNTNTNNPIHRYGIYVQDLIGITSYLKFLAGVRYSSIHSSSNVYSYAKSDLQTASSYADAPLTPRFGLVIQPSKSISVFSSYANSFNINSAIDVNGNAIAPSFQDQYEGGAKTELFNGVLSANVTAYKIVYHNYLVPVQGSTINAQQPGAEVTSKGVELDLMSKPVNGFSMIAGYSFNDTRFTKSDYYVPGSRLRYNPSHTANASVYYVFSGALKGLNAGLIGLYVGDRVAGRSTRTQITNDTYKLMSIPDYFQFDASAGYSFDQFSVRLKVSNMLNQLSYNVHDDNSVNPIAPRMFSATFSYRF